MFSLETIQPKHLHLHVSFGQTLSLTSSTQRRPFPNSCGCKWVVCKQRFCLVKPYSVAYRTPGNWTSTHKRGTWSGALRDSTVHTQIIPVDSERTLMSSSCSELWLNVRCFTYRLIAVLRTKVSLHFGPTFSKVILDDRQTYKITFL